MGYPSTALQENINLSLETASELPVPNILYPLALVSICPPKINNQLPLFVGVIFPTLVQTPDGISLDWFPLFIHIEFKLFTDKALV